MLSVGRVQTPTLKLVVDRDREIAFRLHVPFWAIEVRSRMQTGPSSQVGRRRRAAPTTPAAACSSRWRSRAADACARPAPPGAVGGDRARARRPAAAVRPRHASGGVLQAVGLDVRRRWTLPRRCTRRTRRRPIRAPDLGYLPESMLAEVPTVLDSLVKTDPGLRPLIDRLDRQQRSRAWNDGKVTAHHGIIPDAGARQPLGDERQRSWPSTG